jgi:hypothetical protein
MMLLGEFHRVVREERLFCAVLAHLLMKRGSNLAQFVELVNAQLDGPRRVAANKAADAAVYVEFTYLRDQWYAMRGNNDAKRARIAEMLGRVPSLAPLAAGSLPTEPSEFNATFMGEAGRRIRRDIASPSRWSVGSLAAGFEEAPETFRDLCRVKWSFNIKPDLVIAIPGELPIVVEAKLESSEGSYPTSNAECAIFDRLFGPGLRRVRQVELQEFMFVSLMNQPCQSAIVGRDPIPKAEAPFLAWATIFDALDTRESIAFIERLIRENDVLRGRASAATIPPDDLT